MNTCYCTYIIEIVSLIGCFVIIILCLCYVLSDIDLFHVCCVTELLDFGKVCTYTCTYTHTHTSIFNKIKDHEYALFDCFRPLFLYTAGNCVKDKVVII
jgi:hypothetical protein